ncbi:sigma-70 family RNA polymerase sigma factor [Nocardia arthritidis]|uniref:Sigma-70 family RNA polymerase sigma factor n=1 Tax=Nocardia arthritidis TaxID=228602 RepID=A0A6G9YN06_9NOCA|nr:sigma-70 family RNA polymerase sigma factor [Nocardia arthritidis]QIS14594.1 sigma-70 family RNA polymerase sigma factor [Nocardia arthritidis]
MLDDNVLADRFEAHRPHLTAVAYRMLGALGEADDAVQETWLRLARSEVSGIENLGGWLTTAVGRICLDMLRTRKSRREEGFTDHLPDPIVTPESAELPEQQALLADSIGIALLVVLDTLNPAERVTFVLHDMFAVPFEQIGPIIGKSTTAVRMAASRARRRVQGRAPRADTDPRRQRRAVDAFLAAARNGELSELLAVLDPDVVLRADGGSAFGGGMLVLRGAAAVGEHLSVFQRSAHAAISHPVLVNGLAGLLNTMHGQAVSVISCTVRDGRIATIEVLADRERLRELELPARADH